MESLLSGTTPGDAHPGGLTEIVQALGQAAEAAPSEEEVQRFASQAAASVPLGAGGSESRSSRAGGALLVRRRRLIMRLAGASAAVLVALSAFGGFAYAADGSIPGDSLYGVDLALEKIGIGDGGVRERLNEASQLVERGRAQEGIDLASDAIAESAPDDAGVLSATNALRAAGEAAIRNQNLQTTEELDQAAERLRMMAAEEKTTDELGQAAEELAGSLYPKGGNGGAGGAGGGPGQDQSVTTSTTEAGVGDDQGSLDGTGDGSGAGTGGAGTGTTIQ